MATSGSGLIGPGQDGHLPGRSWHWDARDSRFTVEEYRVVRRVVLGCTDREIARELFMSEWTVRYHLRKVFARFGIRRRIELVQLVTGAPLASEATGNLTDLLRRLRARAARLDRPLVQSDGDAGLGTEGDEADKD
jgi:DNA-binding CsgD family transcriptional regulator